MYAVIKSGGKQHKVKPGDVIEVERLVHEGDTVTFHPILVVDDGGKAHVGKEASRAVVTAKPVGEKKGDKVKVVKYRPKSGYARKAGHRQMLTLLEIEGVKLRAAPKRAVKEEPAAETETETATETESDTATEAKT